jgi:hypothetical protein
MYSSEATQALTHEVSPPSAHRQLNMNVAGLVPMTEECPTLLRGVGPRARGADARPLLPRVGRFPGRNFTPGIDGLAIVDVGLRRTSGTNALRGRAGQSLGLV